MIVAGVATGHIGVQAFDLVGETGFLKEIKRAVDGWRFGRAFSVQIVQQIIRLRRFRAFQEQPEHLAANSRHFQSATRNQRLCFVQESVHILRAAGRIRVKRCVCVGHGRNVVCFALNVKASVVSFPRERL